MVAVMDPIDADALLQAWRSLPDGREAAIIGEIGKATRHVQLHTGLGGERILEELEDDPLPRIC